MLPSVLMALSFRPLQRPRSPLNSPTLHWPNPPFVATENITHQMLRVWLSGFRQDGSIPPDLCNSFESRRLRQRRKHFSIDQSSGIAGEVGRVGACRCSSGRGAHPIQTQESIPNRLSVDIRDPRVSLVPQRTLIWAVWTRTAMTEDSIDTWMTMKLTRDGK